MLQYQSRRTGVSLVKGETKVNPQAEIMLTMVAGGLKPILDEIRARVTALEVENRILRDRLNRQTSVRTPRPPLRRA
jgi:hypothetical protein